MRLFISQPMRDKSLEQIRAERKRVIDLMQALHPNEEIEIIDSIVIDMPPKTNNSALYCLGESLKLMSTADMVYFVHGWYDYRGCKIEHDVAVAYNLTFFEE